MNLTKQNALYELIKKVVIERFSEYDNAILAEYEGQILGHLLISENDILAKCRCKEYINEYRKYMPVHSDDLKEIMNKLCEEEVLFRVKSIGYANPEPVNGYALNRKYAKPIYLDIDEKNQKIYMEKILKNDLMPVFDDLNKLSFEEKLKHRIAFETLSTNIILALMFYGIYTYYDLVTMRQFRLFNFGYAKNIGELQKHLNLLGLRFDMYELNGKIKIKKDEKISKIVNTLEGIHERNEYPPKINYFGNNIFIYGNNNNNFVNRFKAGIKLFNLEKYFELGLFKPSKIDNKRYFYQVNLDYIKIQNDFPYEEINTLLKLIK